MRAVRSKDSLLEAAFRKELWRRGIRYRKHPKGYFGKPDLVNKSKKLVIFIDSCFWHGCPEHCRLPKTNNRYWIDKISRNKERDKKVTKHYKERGWTVQRYWEHDLKKYQTEI